MRSTELRDNLNTRKIAFTTEFANQLNTLNTKSHIKYHTDPTGALFEHDSQLNTQLRVVELGIEWVDIENTIALRFATDRDIASNRYHLFPMGVTLLKLHGEYMKSINCAAVYNEVTRMAGNYRYDDVVRVHEIY